jgi:large subunit ribosomal protein L17
MRHRKRTINKLGRTTSHRESMLAGLVCSLIEEKRVTTTVPKAKAARRLADRVVTLGKRGDLAARRRAISLLGRSPPVGTLFASVAPAFKDRPGGYTRIMKLGRRPSDSAEMAILEWVNYVPPPPKPKKEKAGAKGKEPAAEKEATEQAAAKA